MADGGIKSPQLRPQPDPWERHDNAGCRGILERKDAAGNAVTYDNVPGTNGSGSFTFDATAAGITGLVPGVYEFFFFDTADMTDGTPDNVIFAINDTAANTMLENLRPTSKLDHRIELTIRPGQTSISFVREASSAKTMRCSWRLML